MVTHIVENSYWYLLYIKRFRDFVTSKENKADKKLISVSIWFSKE